MSLNLNKTILAGRICADPELKTTPNGISVVGFTIAVNRPKPKDGSEQKADFLNCVAWRTTAEFVAKYFRKGSAICVTGQLQSRTYTDQQGNKRFATEVLVDSADFVESKNSTEQASAVYTPTATAAPKPVQNTVENSAGITPAHPDVSYSPLGADEDLPF